MKTILKLEIEHDESWDEQSLLSTVKQSLESKKGICFGVKLHDGKMTVPQIGLFEELFAKACDDYKKSLEIKKGDVYVKLSNSKVYEVSDFSDNVVALLSATENIGVPITKFKKEYRKRQELKPLD